MRYPHDVSAQHRHSEEADENARVIAAAAATAAAEAEAAAAAEEEAAAAKAKAVQEAEEAEENARVIAAAAATAAAEEQEAAAAKARMVQEAEEEGEQARLVATAAAAAAVAAAAADQEAVAAKAKQAETDVAIAAAGAVVQQAAVYVPENKSNEDAVVDSWIRGAEQLDIGVDIPSSAGALAIEAEPAGTPTTTREERAAMFEAVKRKAFEEAEAIAGVADSAESHHHEQQELQLLQQQDELGVTAGGATISTVVIIKERTEKLGVGLVNMGFGKGQRVGTVVRGSAAEAAGITPGLYVHSVNGVSTRGMTHRGVIELLANSPEKLVLTMGSPLNDEVHQACSDGAAIKAAATAAAVAPDGTTGGLHLPSPTPSGGSGRSSPLSLETLAALDRSDRDGSSIAAHGHDGASARLEDGMNNRNSESYMQNRPTGFAGSGLNPLNQLHRSDSLTSLVSVAPENVVGRKVKGGGGGGKGGALRIYLKFEPNASAKGDVSGGLLAVRIVKGYNLTASQPYVKLYLSKSGKDIKNSKRKTRTCRKQKEPAFNEQFTVKVPQSLELTDANRLQISVWDHARLKANECVGGMSFSLLSLASTSVMEGWFDVLQYDAGRVGSESSDPSTVPYDNGYAEGQFSDTASVSSSTAAEGAESSYAYSRASFPNDSPSRSKSKRYMPSPKGGGGGWKRPPTVPLPLSTTPSGSSGGDGGGGGGGGGPAALRASSAGGRSASSARAPSSMDIVTRIDPGTSGRSDLHARIAHLEEKNARSEHALQSTTTDLWLLKEKMAQMRWQWAATLVENVEFRHKSLGAAGIGLRTALILTPEMGSLGLEIKNDPLAKYTGVRVSHITPESPADAAGIHTGDVLIAVNGALQLGSTFDEVIAAIVEAGAVIVLSLATGIDVDAPGSPFWDVCDDDDDEEYSDSDGELADENEDGKKTVPAGGAKGGGGKSNPQNWL